jgi:hypothetical protein
VTTPTIKLTLGRDAIRFVVDDIRSTIPRRHVIRLDRLSTAARLIYLSPDEAGNLATLAAGVPLEEAQAVEDWLLDGMPGELQVASPEQAQPAKVDHAAEIGPGSIVEYLGQVYEVSREAHDLESGVRKWRLSGYMSRGVNESALRLVSPFRAGDQFEFEVESLPGPTFGRAAQYDKTLHVWRIDLAGNRYTMAADAEIKHATRELPDGTVAVLR